MCYIYAQSEKVFMVAENSQYWPEVVRAKELIDTGERVVCRGVILNNYSA
jgi:hypothetical protein